ncbi:tol-pal system-associated acyl-CoA thioesterase [Nioella sediminis]|jgi:acyl-CoA thioester hydrolase|uniref:tol-pal system-associated acyl-CoA thioesterase n=1 Tax=Nioella sediminis TaxID=1912092 RepID=UPI0008FCE2CF|nr:tol-pal system-associated acyl-CoA thioesterase [Nioella sediminis]TBX28918.1 thioesterase [Roseovarius sp. JS7-11]
MTHQFQTRVYYEDTDLAGIVYHANYLKFIERARSEMVREAGISQTALKAEKGIVFAVRRMEMDFIAPARFEDDLRVETRLTGVKGASFDLDQSVWRGADRLYAAKVQVVCLTDSGRAVRIPADIRQKLVTFQQ